MISSVSRKHWELYAFPPSITCVLSEQQEGMSMAEGLVDESSLKKGLFKDVRFFLADESNEKVRD